MVLHSLTVENYVKVIYQLTSSAGPGSPATTGQVAAMLGVSPGTVTSMLKTLSESRLVTYMPYEGVRLTEPGVVLALRVLRRHRLIEVFLAKTLNMSWDEVHSEAENMEHAVSDRLIDRIDAYLGHPESDPHGDPIPRRDGTVSESTGVALSQCRGGERFRLTRVLDQSPEFLRFLTGSGLPLGIVGTVVGNVEQSGVVTVEVDGLQTNLGKPAAEKLQVVIL